MVTFPPYPPGQRVEESPLIGRVINGWEIVSDDPYCGWDRPGDRWWCRVIYARNAAGEGRTVYGPDEGATRPSYVTKSQWRTVVDILAE